MGSDTDDHAVALEQFTRLLAAQPAQHLLHDGDGLGTMGHAAGVRRRSVGRRLLGMRERHCIVLIETCRAEPRAGPGLDIGASLSMVTSAAGRDWLAAAQRYEREEVLRAIKRLEPADLAQHWEAVKHERLRLARRGYCTSTEFAMVRLHSVAAVIGARGQDYTGLGCVAPEAAAAPDALGRRLSRLAMGLAPAGCLSSAKRQ